jgi:hypothetical protein
MRKLWENVKYPVIFVAATTGVVYAAIGIDRLIDGPPKEQPVREEVSWEVDRFQTTTVGGRKVTCFIRGVRGGISCVPENE